ncbi:hypothetical protein V1477_016216 [Vespula maculifrons]|uniref:Uncharacterized protein n=1 Tax=Vespula maculifrons TaxID=7453 RepID=A0ABD2BCI5_VESMC
MCTFLMFAILSKWEGDYTCYPSLRPASLALSRYPPPILKGTFLLIAKKKLVTEFVKLKSQGGGLNRIETLKDNNIKLKEDDHPGGSGVCESS